MLDTNVIIALLKDDAAVRRQFNARRGAGIAVSTLVLHELYFGSFKGTRVGANVELIDRLAFDVIDFDWNDARRAGEIRAALAAAGTPIGPYDTLIAGQALARDFIFVTRNIREFSRVPGLTIENWHD